MLNFIDLVNLSFSYPAFTQTLFSSLNVRFHRGWTGIAGANGAGKSTLLKLVTGLLSPDSGHISDSGRKYYCEQSTDQIPYGFDQMISSYDKEAFKIRRDLQIDESWILRWNTLSDGERKRCQVGTALFLDPDVLALDEPSNHLDHRTKEILYSALKKYDGIGLLVSHDRFLLDNLCLHTLFIEKGDVILRKSNYSTALEEMTREDEFNRSSYNNLEKEIKNLKKTAEVLRKKAAASEKLLSKRHIDRNDRDAKGKIDLARITGKDAVAGQKYKRLTARIENKVDYQSSIILRNRVKLGIEIKESRGYGFPLSIPRQAMTAGAKKIEIPDLTIKAGDRIGITGNNGTGKSTFIRAVVNSLNPAKFSFIYIPQEITQTESDNLINTIHSADVTTKSRVMTIVQRLNSDPVRILETENLSPGEVRKLMLSFGITGNPELIIMDEPTNHMDLPSIECIENALEDVQCSLLLVSHDVKFLKKLTNRNWHFEERDAVNSKLKEVN